MLGALHIEMVMLGWLGDWLQDSGWTIALSNFGVTTSGNDSLLSGQDVATTKYVHQKTACTLYNLMKRLPSSQNVTPEENKEINVWAMARTNGVAVPIISILVNYTYDANGLSAILALNSILKV